MTQAVYMAGLLAGSLGFSVISDHFGRRIGLFLSIACTVRPGGTKLAALTVPLSTGQRTVAGDHNLRHN